MEREVEPLVRVVSDVEEAAVLTVARDARPLLAPGGVRDERRAGRVRDDVEWPEMLVADDLQGHVTSVGGLIEKRERRAWTGSRFANARASSFGDTRNRQILPRTRARVSLE